MPNSVKARPHIKYIILCFKDQTSAAVLAALAQQAATNVTAAANHAVRKASASGKDQPTFRSYEEHTEEKGNDVVVVGGG